MGQPKSQRKKYSRPKEPFDKDRLEREKEILKEYGLRRKHEIQRAEGILRNFRRRARDLQAAHDEKKKKELFEKLNSMGLIKKDAKLEDVLSINLENILSRRLQTIIHKKALAHTVKQARQLIVHGHVTINQRKIIWPSYLVPAELEDNIELIHMPKIKPAESPTKLNESTGTKSESVNKERVSQ
ncbi:MAG: 30S ribosomal protein S4 [Candidatus Aenigmarchaeota archaeon]|nr:30S ribosomal protein S4 [Candidatus Aenigmarchaeota archaeon]